MDPWILQPDWRARLTLIFLVACFYSGVVLINNELLFFWAKDASYRYWFYPPAGVRLALVLLLGWPGLVGYFIAALAIASSELIPEIGGFTNGLLVALGRALSLWFAISVYGWFTGIKTPWRGLTWQHVPFLALFVSVVGSIVAHLIKAFIGVETLDAFARNVALNVLGDTLGSIVVLLIIIRLRRAYREWERGRNIPESHVSPSSAKN